MFFCLVQLFSLGRRTLYTIAPDSTLSIYEEVKAPHWEINLFEIFSADISEEAILCPQT